MNQEYNDDDQPFLDINSQQQTAPPRKKKKSSRVKRLLQSAKNNDVYRLFSAILTKPSAESKNISIEQRLTLSPVQKFRKYGRVPYKLCIHICLLVFITFQIVLFTWYRQSYLGNMGEGFVNTFLPEGYEDIQENVDGYFTFYFQSINETLGHVESVVESYETFVETSPDTFVYLPKGDGEDALVKRPIEAEATLYASSVRDVLNYSNTGVTSFQRKPYTVIHDQLTIENKLGHPEKLRDYLGDSERRRDFFDRLKQLKLTFQLQSLDISALGPFLRVGECIQWKVDLIFDHIIRGGRLPLRLIYSFDSCQNMQRNISSWGLKFTKPYLWFTILILTFSILSFFLTVKSIFQRYRLFKKLRILRKLTSVQCYKYSSLWKRVLSRAWLFSKYVSIIDIPSFVNGWNLVTLSTDVVNFISCIMVMVVYREGDATLFFMGFGVLLSYVHIIRYFQYYPKFYTLVLALNRALPSIFRFIIGSIPIFFAFAVCATILFGQYADYFEDLGSSSVTLFAVLNGDALHDVFDMLFGHDLVLAYMSRVYMYIFVLLFICGVLNIFILIMEDAFFSLSKENPSRKGNREDIDGFMNTLDDDDIEDIMMYETRKQEAFDEIEKDGNVTLDDVMNYESLEDNINRLRRFIDKTVSNIQEPPKKVRDAHKSFNRMVSHLVRSIESNSVGTTTHIERLHKRSENVFRFNLSEEHKNKANNPNMEEATH